MSLVMQLSLILHDCNSYKQTGAMFIAFTRFSYKRMPVIHLNSR